MIGDSHIHAVQDALERRGANGTRIPIEVRRLFKFNRRPEHRAGARWRRWPAALFAAPRTARKDAELGDISLDDALKMARRLGPNDVLVSVIGGNQHAVFGTIQHRRPFDFLLSNDDDSAASVASGAELIPYRSIYEFFHSSLRDGDGSVIGLFRKSTVARMVHLSPPPPKRENDWIEHHHDTFFAKEGIKEQGISTPEIRMKFWALQSRATEEICGELGVEVLGPPAGACDENGFLARNFYAGDATHANLKYGELVLQQLEERFAGDGARPEPRG